MSLVSLVEFAGLAVALVGVFCGMPRGRRRSAAGRR